MLLLTILLGILPGPSGGDTPIAPDKAAEARLVVMINGYRAAHGLPAIPLSSSMTKVAEAHVMDMANSADGGASPERGKDERGVPCNSHSWSGRGDWSAVCYTADHAHAAGMWSKPREITHGRYVSEGFEIGHWTSGQATAESALLGWQGSPAHNAVILNKDIWTAKTWRAVGVGVYGHYAYAWFGDEADPAN